MRLSWLLPLLLLLGCPQVSVSRIEMHTTPSKARYTVDGEPGGITPVQITASSGEHTIGFPDYDYEVEIEFWPNARRRVDVDLAAKTVQLGEYDQL